MAAPTPRTVCLRAFNESLNSGDPWGLKPTPPPIPTRIAWPGGKIVSNKDEALANFLRRRLDQGQSLTPEQTAMLEKMVSPNRWERAGALATTAGNRAKRKFNEAGGRAWAGGRVSSTEAQSLLNKLEDKLAPASNSEDSTAVRSSLASSSSPTRRTVDLSSMKRRSEETSSNTAKLGRNKVAATGGGKERHVLPDGQGGFIIATTCSTSSPGPCRTRGGEKLPLLSSAPDIYREKERFKVAADASSKGKIKGKAKSKAFVPNRGRGRPGKWAKKTSSLNSGPTAVSVAATPCGESITVAGGRGGVRGAEPRSLDELMNGGLSASR